jgi:hypothetical protein
VLKLVVHIVTTAFYGRGRVERQTLGCGTACVCEDVWRDRRCVVALHVFVFVKQIE